MILTLILPSIRVEAIPVNHVDLPEISYLKLQDVTVAKVIHMVLVPIQVIALFNILISMRSSNKFSFLSIKIFNNEKSKFSTALIHYAYCSNGHIYRMQKKIQRV